MGQYSHHYTSYDDDHSQEIEDLADQGTSTDDREAKPKSPDKTNENCKNFLAKELGEMNCVSSILNVLYKLDLPAGTR